ncbi:MAG: DMT family transporter [Beijerinckiaceae bacterium]
MLIGIITGLSAGALWGLTFVAPRAVVPYSEVDLAILRYMAFGMTSLVLMAIHPRFRPGPMTARTMLTALWLGLSGYVLYYICVAFSVSLAGPAIAPLVIGALPVVLALYGNWQDKTVQWSRIALPLLLITAGLAVVNWATLADAQTAADRSNILLGFLLALGGLIVWFSYAIVNAKAMRAADAPNSLGWTSLQGLGAMAGVLPLAILAPVMGWSHIPELGFAGAAGTNLIIWALVTGVIASWLAQYFWTIASRRLPLALSAQMIVSETLFALLYGFIFAGRWPHTAEWIGAILLVAGVFIGVQVFSKQATHG